MGYFSPSWLCKIIGLINVNYNPARLVGLKKTIKMVNHPILLGQLKYYIQDYDEQHIQMES